MEGFEQPDPILHRAFGAVITASGKAADRLDDLNLRSPSSRSHLFSIYVLTQHPSTPEAWLKATQELITATEKFLSPPGSAATARGGTHSGDGAGLTSILTRPAAARILMITPIS